VTRSDSRGSDGPTDIGFVAYGTRVTVRVPSADLVPQVVEQLPIDASRCPPGPDDDRFELIADEAGGYAVLKNGDVLLRPPGLDGALSVLRRQLFRHAIEHARDRLAVHAGVVGHQGRAIVLPGPAMIGKTTLVIALLEAGAAYYADDFALVDGDGYVHPYHSLMYIKGQPKVAVEDLGGVRGKDPIPVGLIARIQYRDGATWNTQRRTTADGALMLVRSAYGMDAPAFSLKSAHRAASDSIVLEGERGDAAEAAAALLELVERRKPRTAGS
jgi:hypothetical protein